MRSFDDVLAQVDELAAQFAAGAEKHDRDGSFAFENVDAMKAAGMPRLPVPAIFGGDGFDLYQCTLTLQHIARGDASTALGMAMHFHVIGSLAENNAWAGDAFARLCGEVVNEGTLVNSAASEPEMGSPSRGGLPATTATPADGGFTLNGRKSWVTYAPALGHFLISAAHADGIGIFAVKADSPGLSLIDTWSASLSLRASGSFDVELKDVFVPAHWHVDQRMPGQTRSGALPAGWATCAFAAVYLGVGEAALAAMAGYSRHRVPTALGKPIAELPHIQRGIGQMDVALRGAREVLHNAARKWVTQPDCRAGMEAELAAAKHLCTNAAITVTDIALRTAGASGLDRKLPLERYFRDARAGLMHPPQDDRALELIGRAAIANVEL
jgi:alkylation response protein AidB-like acyl-CoA dehydrogenase